MRQVVGLFAMLSLLFAFVAPAMAQEATPEPSPTLLAALGYPELRITVDDDGVELPDQVNAGRTLIVYENASQESLHPLMLRLPDGVSVDQAMADLGPEAMEPPAWFFEAHFPGFVGETVPGQTTYAVVDLMAGTHLVLHDSAVMLEVVGNDATPTAEAAPTADASVGMKEMAYAFPSTITAGPQVWEVTNNGTVPHEMLLVRSSQPMTTVQIIELFSSDDENATPVDGGPSLADIEPIGGMGWLSPGTTAWTEVDLEAGTYFALCFVYDPETGEPHLMQGMVGIISVDEASPTEATPAA